MTGTFTTRPEIRGSFGVVASTHWIASAVGFGILERGGNAFDAAVAAGFTLQVVEPHLNGPGGEVPAIVWEAGAARARVLCGQGSAPAGATIEHYRAEGLELIPGSGLLATVIPGAFDAWMLMLRDLGTMPLREVMAPAIHYARHGHPLLPRAAETIAGVADLFREHWPTSAETWLIRGEVPAPHANFANPVLADTWERLLAEAEAVSGREAQIERARDAFYRGFVAEAIDRYLREAEVWDVSGAPRKGVLRGEDMARWQARWEAPLWLDHAGWRVMKTGPWGQGPALLQALGMLAHTGVAEMDPQGPDFIHTVIEAIKLAMADREAYYGDPDFFDVPVETLLSEDYLRERAALIGAAASREERPGRVAGLEHLAEAAVARAARQAAVANTGGAGAGEPTMAHLAPREGDTVHLDVIDAAGNMVSATPSGGWLQSSPVIPGLGFALNSRAQMFWLEEGLPSSLRPGARPRTTLTPSLALGPEGQRLAFGTPGGDQQDQWQLIFLLRHLHHEPDMQAVIDAPLFHSMHFVSSFWPRRARPGWMMIEERAGEEVLKALAARGHALEVAGPWSVGRLTAAARDAGGGLRAAATPRLMQAYAVGR
ncbi:gamma-glutamyltranspeptidase / glutathione hydrolase [Meinhardsimonia xiamenensis]|jgi:gamma-glutamyltranspeptidase/glutathione hydrolase|uniref:Gamma-glutamyltranspeptidase / glutathione hydrolase n=1 Tax=Meinhardsimonia xiamenensis TaxID=990712 RepID=A0A1G9BB82_9RHOB|nr:gamma-glutamyltransferase family protein [Meinhardsimonia xiamenensis]PRX35046.1 gamma-glutamyltranspeptidase/glutathione hydrolase [Meinhardsimonia xiamenensis]SDK36719.1 gamma-glutamyltranspeptidase / glutathione hydrolase [Meinhardsimonia xiamenensis]